MFRGVINRVAASAVGVHICAAGVALTDKQLSKKPDWYQKDVRALENSLKRMGRYGFNASPLVVEESYQTLMRFADLSNVEVHWRIARALVEKSFFSKNTEEKVRLLKEAKLYAKKAMNLEGENCCAGAHKWYAVALSKLDELETKSDNSVEIVHHLEKAAKADGEDAYTAHLLGVSQYKRKNYSEALSHFEKAELIKKNFSTCNLYHIGLALNSMGKREQAISSFIAAYRTHPQNEHEVKARTLAKAMLLKLKVKQEDYEIEEY